MWLNLLINDQQLQIHDKIGKEKTHPIFQPENLILITYAKDFLMKK
jgi:hypothetical protein